MKKYYEILEVSPKASNEVIERAYRALIKKYHPDLYEGEEKIYAEKKVRDINEAYKILSDNFLREQYNSELQKELEYDNIDDISKKKKSANIREKIFKKNDKKIKQKNEKNSIGTYRGILDITKTVFKHRPKLKSVKELQREDYIAAGLTAAIVIILLIALWFIPATNGFVKSLIPFID